MEFVTNYVVTERLAKLTNNPLYWFLNNKNFEHIQHDIKSEKYNFGSVYIETLGSDAVGKLNEDSPMVLPMGKDRTLFAVFDGASSQKKILGLTTEGISGAFYISHMASMGFEGTTEYQGLCRREDLTAKDILVAMNDWIYKKLPDVPGINYSDLTSVPGMAAAFLLVDNANKELTIAQVADVTIASVNNEGAVTVLTPNLNEKFDRESMVYITELAKKFNSDLSHIRQIPEAKELFRQHLVESFIRKTNKKGGCGIMNGMPEMFTNKLIYTDSMLMSDKISSILLFSDGAILPYMRKNLYPEASTELLVDTLERWDDVPVLIQGADILDNDPDFIKVPRIKAKDDSTIISVNFEKVSQ